MPITCRTAGLAAALGVGLAIAAGAGIASADATDSASSTTAQQSQSSAHPNRTPGIRAGKVARLAVTDVARTPESAGQSGNTPITPSAPAEAMAAVAGRKPGLGSAKVRTLPSRTTNLQPAIGVIDSPVTDSAGTGSTVTDSAGTGSTVTDSTPTDSAAADSDAPSPSDMTETPYGDIGDWMLQANGQIADWIGHSLDGKTLLEPINVIIIDPTTAPLDKAVMRLNRAMTMAGFPGVVFHSGNYQGLINGDTFQQQPVGDMLGFSDAFFLLPNNHGRIFGPYPPADGLGYIWTAALSREQLGDYEGEITHVFVSFNEARDALRDALVARTGATYLGDVLMDTVYHSDTITTGDSDGHTVVIQLSL